MAPPRRRVSYVIPAPTEPVPHLQLPPRSVSRLGCTGPLLLQSEGIVEDAEPGARARHPRHRLGVASLALDTATILEGHDAPGGILYTGGRDGLVISWDLDIPMKRRERKAESDSEGRLRRNFARWEIMTGWADDVIDEEVEDGEDRSASDGDILGDVTQNAWRRRKHKSGQDSPIPYEQQWETDSEALIPGKVSYFPSSTYS
jgi:WD repeat-containing protein 48